ncbi:ClC family H(+)/Cl(-) exchange transporter [Nakamurella sp. YIM 132087]|uniref:ClC family H(+)/Cl(-) exchange transporter n=1 Tax=Nakamurella alba TaxID=2665158 RepID=A0A7K1FT78_9ACTN|nr:ClC family H(+)/Cl(-) exchange transporter [Nakamurella alba]
MATVGAAVAIGFIGGGFRWCLQRAGELRTDLTDWAHRNPGIGWLVPVLLAAAGAAIARFIVVKSPRSAGSGIQDVEAVWRREHDLPGLDVVPGRFVGGLAAIGPGMVLGREGPTVHMGSALGAAAGKAAGLGDDDRRVLYATVGGAGLAVAFNAPIGGAVFAIEEVTRSFRVRIVVISLLSTAVAVACSRILNGDTPDFVVPSIAAPSWTGLWVFALFGALLGLIGIGYNAIVTGILHVTDRMRRSGPFGPVGRAALIGALVGLLLWFDPRLVDGGDSVTQQLLSGPGMPLLVLLAVLAARFVLGPLCYAAGTPGGLFAPLLAVGALIGTGVQQLAGPLLGEVGVSPLPLAIVGMAAFFTATVQAPLTGIVLIVEMTAVTTLTVPMLIACAAALLVTHLLKAAPVYDSLRRRMLAA